MIIHRQVALYALTHIAGETEYLAIVLNPAVDGVHLPAVHQFPLVIAALPTILIEITHDVVAKLKVLHHKLRHIVDGPQHRLLPLLETVSG